MPILTPPAREALRLARAEQRMLKFCGDLNGLVGRVMVPAEMRSEEGMDALTTKIYGAAIAAGIDYNAVMGGDDPLDQPSWMKNAKKVLARLSRDAPFRDWRRVKELDEEDEDAKTAFAYAEGYFDTGEADPEMVIDLAACLLDFAFSQIPTRRRPPSSSIVFEQTSTDMVPRRDVKELAQQQRDETELEILKSQRMLGTNLKWIATILGGVALLVTGKAIFLPLLLVGWLMAYALIDKKAIEKKQFALSPRKDPLRADVTQEPFVKTEE